MNTEETAAALFEQAGLLHMQGDSENAERLLRESLGLTTHPATFLMLGSVLCARKDWRGGADALRQAAELNPNHAETWRMLGGALTYLGEHEQARRAFERSLALAYAPHALWNYALWLLAEGRWAEGWDCYRWGFVMGGRTLRVPDPEWSGEPIPGKTLLLWPEQGYGDTLFYLRLLRAAKERSGAKIVLEVQPELLSLLQGVAGADDVYARPSDVSLPFAFDAHCALTSLPRVLGVTPDCIPGQVPYITPDPARVVLWHSRLQADGLKVGVCWQGSPTHANDVSRSIQKADFAAFERFFALPGVTCCTLQEGQAPDGENPLTDFADTAAVIANLDLVLTVDTAVAHLAGAMGKECRLLLPFASDYRWLRGTDRTPWYPQTRLYRQHAFQDWSAAFADGERDLRAFAELRRIETHA